jgi:hypothetical protein
MTEALDNGPNIQAQGGLSIALPDHRMSAPEHVDWHMILDSELSQLERPESGIFGSVGFTTLGASIGLIPSALQVLEKITTAPKSIADATPPSRFEILAAVACPVAFSISIVCLIAWGINKYRNSGLSSSIRNRKKQTVGSGAN